MILSDISVKRPVFASVLSILLVAFGWVAFERLSLREYPHIDPPVVTIEVNYPGAPANIVETRITEVVEEHIAGIEGVRFIESSSQDGRSRITLEFSINRDIDAAANDIRDQISGIADDLPVDADPPEVQKVDSNDDVIIWRNLTSDSMTVQELTDYAQRFLVDQYSTVDGVARVRIGGGQDTAMRIWLDREAMAARNLSVGDIEAALRAENVELPAGRLESETRIFRARVNRQFIEPEDFASLVVGRGGDNYLVRLGDIAEVELGVVEDRTFFRGNGVPMVGIGIIRQSTANTIEVVNGVLELTERLNQSLPQGMSIEESYNAAVFIEASIHEVYFTLLVAIACVVLVIYLFLGRVRAMLIPAVTVPVSLVATFIAMYAFGFSLNLLTLLALVLAIGLVVDDAIVMLENIVRRMQEYGEPPLIAAYRGAKQVGVVVISTTVVLIAVFVPITFLEGDIGRLFTQFALTIAAAVSLSSLVALTLCPMLASKLLKSSHNDAQPGRLVRWVDSASNRLRDRYIRLLKLALRRPLIVSLVVALVAGVSIMAYPRIAQEFTPYEDRGAFFLIVNGPEGASYAFMEEYMDEIEHRLIPLVDNGEINRLLVRTPRSFGNIENFNSGFAIAVLNDWSERRPANAIMADVRAALADLPGVRAFPVMRQGLGGGVSKPVQFVLGGSNYDALAEWVQILQEQINTNNPGLSGVDTDYKDVRPQLDFTVDYDRAADLGVSITEVGRTLETMMGGRRITTYLNNGEEYDVIVEGMRDNQRSLTDVSNIYVRSSRSPQLIPLSNLVDIQEYGAAETLPRFNRIRSITLEANLSEGYSLGEALSYLQQLVRTHLPPEAMIDYKGQSRDFIESGSSILFVFLLGLLVVYLVLAAQFESYIHPLVVMVTVPLALAGGLLGLYFTDNSLNIYSQIGLIMLVGLAAKNSILIVEFANQLRDRGMSFDAALMEASSTRFRPILMTGLTTIAGTIPLVLTSGAGAETRIAIGTVVLAGVMMATVFTLFIVPVAYQFIARGTGSPGAISRAIAEAESPAVLEQG
ncbi:efflux RND transporter permease subunit [Microbulbifer spongiae]|uniref:Efflux RND transporter permease subunit n=1 Tax=Microbulbifer spongiae TaxID=2944933 RepID=A0ABY9EH65_9GAMM|nr:efflux RND transporter permease subunit [Microbulbifer sp. MI-G]WKD50181.1 efflux RND transporter permease subunit [Microbulbifer sp. MI-G]